MRITLLLLTILAAGCVCGPKYPAKFRAEIKKNHLRNSQYHILMRGGLTSKLQDIEMQKANADAWKALQDIMEGAK